MMFVFTFFLKQQLTKEGGSENGFSFDGYLFFLENIFVPENDYYAKSA